jgi:hypothetical protein
MQVPEFCGMCGSLTGTTRSGQYGVDSPYKQASWLLELLSNRTSKVQHLWRSISTSMVIEGIGHCVTCQAKQLEDADCCICYLTYCIYVRTKNA